MPHLTLQNTANAVIKHPDTLLQTLNQALWNSGEFAHPTEIKSRVIAVDDFLVALDDAKMSQGFVYAELKVMAGRDENTKRQLASLIMTRLQQYFSQQTTAISNRAEIQICVEVVKIASVYQKQSLSL